MKNVIRAMTLVCSVLLVAACGGDHSVAPAQNEVDVPDELFPDVTIPTYEASGETVHPDVAEAPAWWPGQPRYLVVTPYPNGNETFENPSLFIADTMNHWRLPEGEPNPLVLPHAGHLSDPDVLFNEDTHEMWVYYRLAADKNVISLIRSRDGLVWSSPDTVVSGAKQTIVSPSVVRRQGPNWLMWSVNAGSVGCSAKSTSVELRLSTDGLTWTVPQTLRFPLPPSGLMPWHLDVQWIPSRQEFWMVFNGKNSSSCGTTALYFATSPDGVTWKTQAEPMLVAGDIPAFKDIVYRTTFEYEPSADRVTLWYSGARKDSVGVFHWRTVARRMARKALFAKVHPKGILTDRVIPPTIDLRDPP